MNDFENNQSQQGFNIDMNYAESLPDEPVVTPKNTLGQEILEWVSILSTAIIIVIVFFSFFFKVSTIVGDSMLNTLVENDKIIVNNFNYTPKQGDIVIISRNIENSPEATGSNAEPIIKRVIATGGQTVDIDFETGIVYVDGQALEEDYLGSPTHRKYDVQFPLYIPEGHIFVLGDNRMVSLDSRSSSIGDGGIIDNRYVLGRAVYRFYPFDKMGVIE